MLSFLGAVQSRPILRGFMFTRKSFEDFAIALTPTRCIYELIRDKNRLLQIIGHLRFGKHCGYPLCCRLEFAVRLAFGDEPLLAVSNHCHPSSPKWRGCDSDFVHCKWHAFLGHKKQKRVTEDMVAASLMRKIVGEEIMRQL